MGVTMSLATHLKILLLAFSAVFLGSCSSRAIHEAEAVVAQADSLWQAGLMYGIDAGDSLSLAQAYKTLEAIPLPYREGLGLGSPYAHACYHYGKLLRAKDHPAEAMQAFINATHSRTRDYHILGRVYSNMGSICHLAGEFQLSYDMFEKSANCFLADNDSLSYYFLLNEMAFELAASKSLDSCLCITQKIQSNYSFDNELMAFCYLSEAEAYLRCGQYDSAIYYAYKSKSLYPIRSAADIQLAQAYSLLNIKDSAVCYANAVLNHTDNIFLRNNALYILTNDDMSKDKEAIRETAADRSDVQKLLSDNQGKLSQAVQLLEQDLAKTPDLRWLYAVIATIIVIGSCLLLYIHRKRNQHKLLSQQVDDLTSQTIAMQIKKEELTQSYSNNYNQIKEDIDHKCTLLHDSEKIKEHWHGKITIQCVQLWTSNFTC